jgi:hypothetical protein
MGTTATTQARQQQHKGGRKHPEDSRDGRDGLDSRKSRDAQTTSKARGRVQSWHESQEQKKEQQREKQKLQDMGKLTKMIDRLYKKLGRGERLIEEYHKRQDTARGAEDYHIVEHLRLQIQAQENLNNGLKRHITSLQEDKKAVEDSRPPERRFIDRLRELLTDETARVSAEVARDKKLMSDTEGKLLVDEEVWRRHEALLKRPIEKLRSQIKAEEAEQTRKKREYAEARARREAALAEKAERERITKEAFLVELREKTLEIRDLQRTLRRQTEKLSNVRDYISLEKKHGKLRDLKNELQQISELEHEMRVFQSSGGDGDEQYEQGLKDMAKETQRYVEKLLEELDIPKVNFKEAESRFAEVGNQLSALERVLGQEFKSSKATEYVRSLEKNIELLESILKEKQASVKELEKKTMPESQDSRQFSRGLSYL